MGLFTSGCALGMGCSSSGTTGAPAGGEIDHPEGFPFIVEADLASDVCGGPPSSCAQGRSPALGATTATLSQPAAGKICMNGTVQAGGYAFAVLVFTEYNEDDSKVLTQFNADALGITQVAFTLDSPPTGGVTVIGAVVKQSECPGSANGVACRVSGFDLMTDPPAPTLVSITQPGPQVAPFANFKQGDPTLSSTFNTAALDSFAFVVGAGAYEFCIHDFKLLDAAGNEVTPP